MCVDGFWEKAQKGPNLHWLLFNCQTFYPHCSDATHTNNRTHTHFLCWRYRNIVSGNESLKLTHQAWLSGLLVFKKFSMGYCTTEAYLFNILNSLHYILFAVFLFKIFLLVKLPPKKFTARPYEKVVSGGLEETAAEAAWWAQEKRMTKRLFATFRSLRAKFSLLLFATASASPKPRFLKRSRSDLTRSLPYTLGTS